MVSRDRFLPAICVGIFVYLFYLLNYDLFFFAVIIFLFTYDFFQSKTLNFKTSIFYIIFFFLLSYLIIHYELNIKKFIYIVFFVFIFLFFYLKNYQRYFFVILNSLIFILFLYFLKNDKDALFILILISFINDTSAFLIGRFFKGPLILENISPKKTWSGTLGSFLISTSLLIYLNFNFIISLIISISFFLGDILFSYYKRKQSIKDFSNLLGGHGGILDRFDSIFFPILIFSLYSY